MRNGGLAVLMIAGAMATAWAAANALHTQQAAPGVDTSLKTAAIARPSGEVFRLSSVTANESCLIVKGETLSPGFAELKVNPACERLMPGVSNARFWRERPDGSVAFTASSSAPIVEFAAGEGVEYESYAPSSVFLSLKGQ